MQFNILDTLDIYNRLLDEPDAGQREAIYRAELVEPFAGLATVFGGSDPVASFGMWGMPLALFDAQREHTRSVVDQLAAANAWRRAASALDNGYAAFAAYADRIPLDRITFGLMVADMSGAPQAGGYSGFGAVPGWIMTVYGEPNAQNLRCVEAATVHELHHNLASAAGAVGFKNMMTITVGEYMIGEGLAESFAAELYGKDTVGPWVTQFDDTQLEHTKTIFREGLNQTGFNLIRSYIFGGPIAEQNGLPKVDVPLYAGYALGYRVVQAYMQRTGKKVIETTFTPPDEIIEESRFFA